MSLRFSAVILLASGLWLVIAGFPGKADTQGAEASSLTIDSKAVGEELPVKVVVPEGAAGEARPLLVFLHGRGGNENSELVDEMYSALADQGERAPVIAFPYGGESSYWHDRADGDWGRYVTDEVIPPSKSASTSTRKRVAIGGISMGGYGAYDIAAENPGPSAPSAVIRRRSGRRRARRAAGAFDDADDFARNDVIAAANEGVAFGGHGAVARRR